MDREITAYQAMLERVQAALGEIQTVASSDDAAEIRGALDQILRLNFGGQTMYVPVVREPEKNRDIYLDYIEGRSPPELARKYRCSITLVYSAIKHEGRAGKTRQPAILEIITEYLPVELGRSGVPQDAATQLCRAIAERMCQEYCGQGLFVPRLK